MLGVSDLLRRPLARHDVRLRPPATGCLETSACARQRRFPIGVVGKPAPRELGSLTNGTELKSHKWNRTIKSHKWKWKCIAPTQVSLAVRPG